ESEVRREPEDQTRTVERIVDRSHPGNATVERERLIQRQSALVIEDVEPISSETQFLILTDFPREISSEVQVRGERSARVSNGAFEPSGTTRHGRSGVRDDRRSTRHRKTFVVSIHGVRNQLVVRNTGLGVEVAGNDQLPRGAVTAVELENVRPIVRQTSVQVRQEADQVEQRSDVRVRLPVVVSEQTFVVTNQAR